jgi:hypothetical protein
MWVLVLVLAHVTKLDLLTQLNPLLLLLLLLLLLYMLRSLRLHAHLLTHCIFLPPPSCPQPCTHIRTPCFPCGRTKGA